MHIRLYGILILLIVSLSACKKDSDTPYDPNVYYVPSALHFSGLVNGIPYLFATDEGNYSNVSTVEYDFNGGTEGLIHFNSAFQKPNAPWLTFKFKNYYLGDSLVTTEEFSQIFGIGVRQFTPSSDPSLPGVAIEWKDAGGNSWHSDTGPQGGRFFNVDQKLFGGNSITETVTLTVSFNCILYRAPGDSILLEEGEANILFSKPVF